MAGRFRKSHGYILAGVLLVFALGFGLGRRGSSPPAEPEASVESRLEATGSAEGQPLPDAVTVSIEGRPFRGPVDAPVTMVEFTDYQCPFCQRHFQNTYPQLLSEYGDRVKYVIRNLPLANIHPYAEKAAEAAECAYEQGKFWEYHDLLFTRAPALSQDSLKRYAMELGLEKDTFGRCLDSGIKKDIVVTDVRAALALGVRGTPAFFINGRTLIGAQPVEVFRQYIDSALQETRMKPGGQTR